MNIFDPLNPRRPDRLNPDQGTFLIAEPFLRSSAFSRTVILLCEHSTSGTLGFVLNRPSPDALNMLLPKLDFPLLQVYDGGPVQTNTIQIVHRLPDLLGGVEILPGIFWGGSYDDLKRLSLLPGSYDDSMIRIFRGYSGWDPGQLDHEMEEGSWIIAPATPELIFDPDTDKIWSSALASLGRDYERLAAFPIDPILN